MNSLALGRYIGVMRSSSGSLSSAFGGTDAAPEAFSTSHAPYLLHSDSIIIFDQTERQPSNSHSEFCAIDHGGKTGKLRSGSQLLLHTIPRSLRSKPLLVLGAAHLRRPSPERMQLVISL
ncbi:hypothetical protein PsorP6_001969 [Peronosclerospora sorghi]|uniref:Uncharacterized protein n=1 Tax=Peronosclerospora sorghi TaxID=230839 RepID=A0ACC0WY35_9STRA|nr:hypothetical protein PsorP6_001969 [Peronosclerospora sorghi]